MALGDGNAVGTELVLHLCREKPALVLNFGLLHQLRDPVTSLPHYLLPPEDEGIAGAELALRDSNGSGKFLGHKYQLETVADYSTERLIEGATSMQAQGIRVFLTNADTAGLQSLRNALGSDAILVNYGNPDDKLRRSVCLEKTLHTYPSRSMQTDALAQWMRYRRLGKTLLLTGRHEADREYAAQAKLSMKKFGLSLLEEKSWTFDTDLRRTAGAELPLFTQGGDYDVVWIADESQEFGPYVPYNTWLPRPVIGTQGLRSTAWAVPIEQWAAIQLQNRFRERFERYMNSTDYAAWVGLRMFAEVMTKLNTNEPQTLYTYLLSPDFELAAYKGRKLSLRPWSAQLRQPMPIHSADALVATAPFEGFIHPTNELDTLGADKQDSQCKSNI